MASTTKSTTSRRSSSKSTSRAKAVKKATGRVKTKAPINFSRSVRGR